MAVDEDAEKALKKCTMTDLYSDPPDGLVDVQRALDRAVHEAYGLPQEASETAVLDYLLALNVERGVLPLAS